MGVFVAVSEWGSRYGLLAMTAGVGMGLVGYGLWQAVRPEEPKIEIVRSEEIVGGGGGEGEIVVDVGGAVEKPGVYRLVKEMRVGEAIVRAGGLSAEADRVWVTRYVNLASPLTDGGKIYIPYAGEEGLGDQESDKMGETMGVSQAKINLNTASREELDGLWGIGEARAETIISNRPYSRVEELVSKAGIPSNVYERIKNEVVVE